MKQFRGCSRLYYATYTVGSDGAVTFGEPKQVAPVKTVSRDIASDSEKVFADNIAQEQNFAATTVTRTFSCVRLDPAVEAALLGLSVVSVGEKKAYATPPSGAPRPYLAFGYALHDGDVDNPCEVVWAYRGKVTSISKTANTIDDGTGSDGQDVEVEFTAPEKKWTATGKRDLDLALPITAENVADVDKWFAKVITPDNIATELA